MSNANGDEVREVGKHVREAREALGWKQTDLATRSGYDVRTIRRLEAGLRVSDKTVSEIRAALTKARPHVVELKAPSGAKASGAAALTVTPAEEVKEELRMTESVHDEITSDQPQGAQIRTGADLLLLAKTDPAAADEFVTSLMAKPRAPETTEEKLSMGYEVIQFLERFSEAEVYVMWDTGDPEDRKTLGAFIATATQVSKAIDQRSFDSAQRFQAQCTFADQLNVIHKHSWRVMGLVTRKWDLEGYSITFGNIVIDQGI